MKNLEQIVSNYLKNEVEDLGDGDDNVYSETQIADAFIAGYNHSKWIEINEDRSNLPEEGIDVLVTVDVTHCDGWDENDGNNETQIRIMYTSCCSLTGTYYFYDIGDDEDFNVKYVLAWMPLPEKFKKQ